MPVANALGLGSSLKEVEELSYRALFPDSYDRFAAWHRTFTDAAQVALLQVTESGRYERLGGETASRES